MDNEFIQKVLDDNRELSSLPQTMAEVIRAARDENTSAEQMARVMKKDLALTARVLRMVNSPFYGRSRQISSMTEAVVTIGMRQITALALSSSVYQLTSDWTSELDRVRFWRHSLEVAIGAQMIAEKAGYRNTEEVFAGGLLHDIGLLILEKSFPQQFGEVWNRAEREGRLIDLEVSFWGTNHAHVGQFLLEQWQLPETICNAVGQHHTLFEPDTRTPELKPCQIVNLAHLISKFTVSSETPVNTSLLVNKEILRNNLDIPSSELLDVEKNLFSRTMTEASYLEIDVGSIDDVLLEANRMLFEQYVNVENLLKEVRDLKQQVAHYQAS